MYRIKGCIAILWLLFIYIALVFVYLFTIANIFALAIDTYSGGDKDSFIYMIILLNLGALHLRIKSRIW